MYRLKWIQVFFCAFIAVGCTKNSGNLWEDNQTGARYKESTLNGQGRRGRVDEEFISLNDEDLRSQFSEISFKERDLDEAEMPIARHFNDPHGFLASIFCPLFFDTDQHVISERKKTEYTALIRQMASYLKSHPETYVIIEGHCDKRGPEAYNLALGTRRSYHVYSLLINEGVNPAQLRRESFGKEKPFALGDSDEDLAQNRRAHFQLYVKQ